jgi:hypothetical protein
MMSPVCRVCGEERGAGQVWFLLMESPWEDKLRILHWQDRLVGREGIHPACSPEHVQELVTHWMTVGTLDYPFAESGDGLPPSPRSAVSETLLQGFVNTPLRQVGEISVHRESMGRILEENLDALQAILDELTDVLQRESDALTPRFESARRISLASLRQM